MRLIRLMEVALCAVILTAAATTARAVDPVKIRIGWIAAPANLAPILFAKPGIAQNLGKTYELEPIRFNGSPPMITANAIIAVHCTVNTAPGCTMSWLIASTAPAAPQPTAATT